MHPRHPHPATAMLGLLVVVIAGTTFSGLGVHENPSFREAMNATMDPGEISSSAPGVIDDGTRNVFWFLHVTDTQDCWFHEDRVGWFHRFFNESMATIDPAFIVNTGDLVNTVYDDILAPFGGQVPHEWETYKGVLDAEGINASMYYDLMGNHDAYGDHGFTFYRNHSIQGPVFDPNTDVLQVSWNVSTSQGVVAFLGLHTPENLGVDFPFEVWGIMTPPELDWVEAELDRYRDARLVVALGHHPLQDIVPSFSTSGATLDMLLATRGVEGYFYGHNHMHMNEYLPELGGLRAIQTARFTNNGGSYRIVAVDGFRMSSQPALVGSWPQAIITTPAPADHLAGSQAGSDPGNQGVVRVLAWDPAGVDAVEIKIDGEDAWTNASHVTGPVWELARDLAGRNGYQVHARVRGGSGQVEITIHVDAAPAFTVGHRLVFLLIFWGTVAAAATLTSTWAALRLKVRGRYEKRPEQSVQPRMRRLFLLKCLVLAAVPFTIAPMINNAPVIVFSLFSLALDPLVVTVNVVVWLYALVLFLGGILPHGLLLNPGKTRRGILVATPVSIALAIVGLLFFLPRYPLSLAWIAPGFYLFIACDVLMLREGIRQVSR